jgi:4-amino-4-deoxy-L-arabinose transferase-like glycosyltransferase
MASDRTDRWREHAALGTVLVIAAALRLWRFEDNGFGTLYYAAGVRSMMQSGWLFFYNAFDPAGFVSLDKPPIAFWIQTLCAHLLGYSGWAIHLPQALAGVASVAVLHGLVRQSFGWPAALYAALLLALTPVVVAIDRSNNTDSWLILFLLLAAWAALRGRGLSLVAAMVLLGVAFNVKMLAALICGPALLAGWLLATPLDWRRRLGWMALSGVTLAVVSLAWAVAFDLTPAGQRPYAGSSKSNSMLELIVVHNGLERFVRPQRAAPAAPPTATARFEMYDSVPVGPLRLAHPSLAPQFAWMLPLAVLGAVLGWRRQRAAIALWSVWALCYGAVYSAAGGIFHGYYLSTLGPPLAALAAIGGVELWRRGPRPLAAGLALIALWQGLVAALALGWTMPWLGFPLIALAASCWVAWRDTRPLALLGGAALLGLPVAWALSTIFSPGNLTLPSASLARWLGKNDGRGPILSRDWRGLTDDPQLATFLEQEGGDVRYLAAAPNALLSAPLIIRTGQPVMAFGGYFGTDPVIDLAAFAGLVERGEVRFAILSNARRQQQRDFDRWVMTHGVAVEPNRWRSLAPDPWRSITLYELRPN